MADGYDVLALENEACARGLHLEIDLPGARVMVTNPARGTSSVATITKANANGTYAIKYSDGSIFSKVDPANLAPYNKATGKGRRSK